MDVIYQFFLLVCLSNLIDNSAQVHLEYNKYAAAADLASFHIARLGSEEN